MAIKGKKKTRGAQGVRRPAAAPRPQISPKRRHTPFYKTRDGIILLSIFGLVAIGTVVWLVMSAQNEAKELEAQQAALEQYTDQIGPVLQSAAATANEMTGVTEVPENAADLTEQSEGWITDLQGAQTGLSGVVPAPEVDPVNQLFNESISLYVASAETFALVPKADEELQADLFTRATVQRDTASAVWASAIDALDEIRDLRDLGSSGLNAPQPAPPDPLEAQPGAEVTIPAEEPADGAEDPAGTGDGKGGSKDGKGDKDDG